jgi:hypothetical protein
VRAGLNFQLTYPYWNTDTGGFGGGDWRAMGELVVRWFQFSIFTSITRLHGDRHPSGPQYTGAPLSEECDPTGQRAGSDMTSHIQDCKFNMFEYDILPPSSMQTASAGNRDQISPGRCLKSDRPCQARRAAPSSPGPTDRPKPTRWRGCRPRCV